MKIKKIISHYLEAELKEAFCFSQACYDKRTACLVEIETDSGIVGWGECYGPHKLLKAVIDTALTPLLIREEADNIERIWHKLYTQYQDHGQKGVLIQAMSGIDIALWDIKGKALNQPVYKLLGGAQRTKIKAYATGFYLPKEDDINKLTARLATEAKDYVKRGFKAVKMKVGFGVKRDIALVQAVREAIGDDIELMIDANHAYDAVGATKLGKALEGLDIGWFEEPVAPEDLNGYKTCREKMNIPIAGGECQFTRYGFAEFVRGDCVDIWQPDTCAAGGLSECKKIAVMADAFGYRYNPHCWGTAIALYTNLHLLAHLPFSSYGLSSVSPMLEYDCTEHPIRHTIVKDSISVQDGYVSLPQAAGLGFEVDRQKLEEFLKSI